MKDTRQLEFVAVTLPKSDACLNADCDGHVEWLDSDNFPQCDRCSKEYWFREVADGKADDRDGQIAFLECESRADAKTITMLEAVVEAAKRGAARGADGKPKDIAEAKGNCVRFGGEGNDWFQVEYEGLASDIERAANKAHDCEVNTDAKTISDFEAGVKTLSETISGQAERHRDRATRILDAQEELWLARDTIAQLKREQTPAPTADAREAFEAWAGKHGFDTSTIGCLTVYDSHETRAVLIVWLAALEWRGGKPKGVAAVEEDGQHPAHYRVVVNDHVVVTCVSSKGAHERAAVINHACGCEEATDGN